MFNLKILTYHLLYEVVDEIPRESSLVLVGSQRSGKTGKIRGGRMYLSIVSR